MQKLLFKYRNVFISGIVLFSLMAALLFNDSALRDLMIGLGSGAAFIIFAQNINEVKQKENDKCIKITGKE